MPDPAPILAWLRRDLRLGDHPMLHAAAASGRPVIPVWICDEVVQAEGAAPRWRLGLGVEHFARRLESVGSRLVLRRGNAAMVLRDLVTESGAGAVWWTRLADPRAVARDRAVAEALAAEGVEARSFPGHDLFDPAETLTGSGTCYKVFTPYWKSLRPRSPGDPLPAVAALAPPVAWPSSECAADRWFGAAMDRGAAVVAPYLGVGEAAAADRLAGFVVNAIGTYAEARDFPSRPGTSGLSENLTYGEISARTCWHAARRAEEEGRADATFRKELVWRDFAHYLLHHTPRLADANWRPEWDAFPWRGDNPEAEAWRRGRTGMPIVDAAMREMFVTGRMHNRARMIAASYLCKHLMTHWKVGLDWFADVLVDWDPASNAMGWQWSAGSGPDATPFFRVFNPEAQRERFDPDGRYLRRWIAEGQDDPSPEALAYFDAIPRSWRMSAADPYPDAPVVSAAEGRRRALAAYQARKVEA